MSARSQAPRIPRGTTRPLYTGLRIRNVGRSIRFYRALGFRTTHRSRTALGEFAQMEHPYHRFTIELNRFRPGRWLYEPYRRGSEMDHFGFWVDDVDVWVRRLVRLGGRIRVAPYDCGILLPPRSGFPGRAAYVADPDGIWIELMGPPRSTRPRQAAHRSG